MLSYGLIIRYREMRVEWFVEQSEMNEAWYASKPMRRRTSTYEMLHEAVEPGLETREFWCRISVGKE